MNALSRIPDGSHLPTIDATATFDRRLGIEKTVKQLRKQLGIRGPSGSSSHRAARGVPTERSAPTGGSTTSSR
jgi:hypothetical protein